MMKTDTENETFYTIVLYEKSNSPFLPAKYIMTLPYRFSSYKAVTKLRDILNEEVGNRFFHVCSFIGKKEFEKSDDIEVK